MVIAAGRLDEVVPLEPASMPGRVVVQWDKDDCADLGIVKVDLLGPRDDGGAGGGGAADPAPRGRDDRLRAGCPPTTRRSTRMLRAADTVGVFQVESRAQMATLPRMQPTHFYDLVVEVAIIRPGPIVGKMVNPYLAAPQRPRAGALPAPVAGADPEAHAGRAAVSGAADPHGDDRRPASRAARPTSCGARWGSSARRSA